MEASLRPRTFALLLLASGDRRPRPRARDQRADEAGAALKLRLLDRLAALDPEPAELEGTLARVVEELGPPPGPARAVARVVLEEWQMAVAAPEWVAVLLGEGVARPEGNSHGRRLSS